MFNHVYKRLCHYCSVYQGLFSCSVVESTGFRANFVFMFILGCVSQLCVYYGITILFNKVSHIGVWDRETFLFFASYMIVVLELHNTFVTRNYWELYDLIVKGNFDFLLLKPLHPIFLTFFRYCRIANFLLLFLPVSALIYFGTQIPLSLEDWCLLPFLILLSFILLTLLGILMSCFVFWSYQGAGINFLRIQVQEMASWPDYLFISSFRFLFSYVFPVLLIGSAPVRYLRNATDYKLLLLMLFECVVLCILIRFFWRRAMVQYESASS